MARSNVRMTPDEVQAHLARLGQPLGAGSMALHEEPTTDLDERVSTTPPPPMRSFGGKRRVGARITRAVGDDASLTTDELFCLANLLLDMRAIAKPHGWRARETYQALGPDQGVECTLARPGDGVIIALLVGDGCALTSVQQDWVQVLRLAGGVEVHVWRPADLAAITERLTTRPAQEHRP